MTHQLRVLGRASFDEVLRSDSAGHYEVLLRSTIHGGPRDAHVQCRARRQSRPAHR